MHVFLGMDRYLRVYGIKPSSSSGSIQSFNTSSTSASVSFSPNSQLHHLYKIQKFFSRIIIIECVILYFVLDYFNENNFYFLLLGATSIFRRDTRNSIKQKISNLEISFDIFVFDTEHETICINNLEECCDDTSSLLSN